jgi:hypothetical protein
MKKLKFNIAAGVICICLFFVSWSCFNVRSQIAHKGKPKTMNWINAYYVNCMKRGLPCDCEKKAEPFVLIRIDTNQSSNMKGVWLYGYSDMEFIRWQMEKESKNRYKIFSKKKDGESVLGVLSFKDDSLYFIDKDKKLSVYSNFGNSMKDDEYEYQNENIRLLNMAFLQRKYPNITSILGKKVLKCDCNKELGGVNLISSDSASWVIEQNIDSINIYRFIDTSSVKSFGQNFQKKLFKKYKW